MVERDARERVLAGVWECLPRGLTRYCYRTLALPSFDAEDCPEASHRHGTAAQSFDPARASLRTWLYSIATNLCPDALRTAGRPREPLVAAVGLAYSASAKGDSSGLQGVHNGHEGHANTLRQRQRR